MLGGLIAAAAAGIKGGAEGLNEYAKGELEQNRKLDLSKQLTDIQLEKDLRLDEVKRAREKTDLIDYGTDEALRAGARAKAADAESSATKATAATATWELGVKKSVQGLRDKLSKSTDETERADLNQQITDLVGTLNTKSFSDVVVAAESWRKMAASLRKDAELKDGPEKDELLARARGYEDSAAATLSVATTKRLGKPATPKPDEAPKKSGQPWNR
jgi:hypothetical protein